MKRRARRFRVAFKLMHRCRQIQLGKRVSSCFYRVHALCLVSRRLIRTVVMPRRAREYRAATRIQVFRRVCCTIRRWRAATRLQAWSRQRSAQKLRKRLAREKQLRDSMQLVAIRIQTAIRGLLARRKLVALRRAAEQNRAATKLQAVLRGRRGRARAAEARVQAETARRVADQAKDLAAKDAELEELRARLAN